MIFRRSARAGQQASLLFITLILSGILGVTLASYLIMVQTQNTSVFRSQNWNSTMVVAEAGIEDGMQLINQYAGSVDDAWKWTNNTSANGWDGPNNNVYHVKRFLPFQTASGAWLTNSYEVWITNTNNAPSIWAVGTVPWTYQYAAAPQPMFAQIGSPAPGTLSRQILARTQFTPLFMVAMAALGQIDLNGQNVATDSFDSSDPNYSEKGFYPSNNLAKIKAKGDVCTDAALINSLKVGNANIMGHVRTGPGSETIYVGPNGSVGDKYWVSSKTVGIQPGYSATDFNVIFDDVLLPDTSWLSPSLTPETIDGVTYGCVIKASGDYYLNDLTTSLYIGTNANVRLLIKGKVNLSGANDAIRISPQNATLRIYMDGPSFSVSGTATIDNQSGLAERFYLFGTPNCTSITLAGNGNFYGGIYAPEADFALGGGGNDIWDFIGASVTKTVRMNGHYNFHFDENLSKVGPSQGYIVKSWEEK